MTLIKKDKIAGLNWSAVNCSNNKLRDKSLIV
jgi:hypothetical protein